MISTRTKDSTTQLGYTFEESTWEPEENFKRQTIDLYNRRRKEDQEEESDSDDEHLTMMDVSAEKSETAPAETKGMEVDGPPQTHTIRARTQYRSGYTFSPRGF